MKVESGDGMGVPRELLEEPPCDQVPDLDLTVGRGRGDPLSVGGELHVRIPFMGQRGQRGGRSGTLEVQPSRASPRPCGP